MNHTIKKEAAMLRLLFYGILLVQAHDAGRSI